MAPAAGTRIAAAAAIANIVLRIERLLHDGAPAGESAAHPTP